MVSLACNCYGQDSTVIGTVQHYADLLNEAIDNVEYLKTENDSLIALVEMLAGQLGLQTSTWYGYEIDSLWLGVNLPDGELPRRANGTYLYWKADSLGNLFPAQETRYYFTDGNYFIGFWER